MRLLLLAVAAAAQAPSAAPTYETLPPTRSPSAVPTYRTPAPFAAPPDDYDRDKFDTDPGTCGNYAPNEVYTAEALGLKGAYALANDGADEEFVRVKRAWDVLSDPDDRKEYDAQLASRRVDVVINEHLDLNDLQSEEGYFTEDELDMNYDPPQLGKRLTCRFWHPCRCGGGFEVMADELHQDFDHVDLPCFNCSLHVRVTYGCE